MAQQNMKGLNENVKAPYYPNDGYQYINRFLLRNKLTYKLIAGLNIAATTIILIFSISPTRSVNFRIFKVANIRCVFADETA